MQLSHRSPSKQPAPYQFVLPESFEPREFLSAKLHRRADDARYLASTILWKTAIGRVDDRGRVVLNAKSLNNIMAKDYTAKVIGSLCEAGVIHRDHYIRGEKSYSYWLGDRFRFDQHIRRNATDGRLIGRLQKFQESWKEKQRSRMREVHFHLERQQQRLKIDVDYAKSILATFPRDKNLFDTQGLLVSNLAKHRMHFSVGQYGRVANAITNLSRDLRPALRHKGKPLHSVDIRSCQPALLGHLVAKAAGGGNRAGQTATLI